MTPLASAISAYVAESEDIDGFRPTPLAGLLLGRMRGPTLPVHVASVPSLCVVAQGAKSIAHEATTCNYTAMQFVLVPIDMPLTSAVTHASAGEPFFGLILDLDLSVLFDVASQLRLHERQIDHLTPVRLRVYDLSVELADALRRIVESLRRPEIAEVLYPALMREICLWLLTSTNGEAVPRVANDSGAVLRLSSAIKAMRSDLARPLRLAELAAVAQMSVSTFHGHFSTLTGITPMQFQKQLRLIEARRLMFTDSANVGEAARRVGYESASHFSRDYTRMFGISPRRDVLALPSTTHADPTPYPRQPVARTSVA